jgi:hypothetical protein
MRKQIKQRIFNKVAKHLLTQNRKASRYNNNDISKVGCAYKSDDGAKCAIGCLIPDNIYFPDMEGKSFGGLLSNYSVILNHFKKMCRVSDTALQKDGRDFFFALQKIHDNIPVETWKFHLASVANTHGLNKKVLNETNPT